MTDPAKPVAPATKAGAKPDVKVVAVKIDQPSLRTLKRLEEKRLADEKKLAEQPAHAPADVHKATQAVEAAKAELAAAQKSGDAARVTKAQTTLATDQAALEALTHAGGAAPLPEEPQIEEEVIREMQPNDPPFVLTGGGTGWWGFKCGPIVPPEEVPANEISGSVEAQTRAEAEERISERFPGAQFTNPAATPPHTPTT